MVATALPMTHPLSPDTSGPWRCEQTDTGEWCVVRGNDVIRPTHVKGDPDGPTRALKLCEALNRVYRKQEP